MENLNNNDFPFEVENWDSAKTATLKEYLNVSEGEKIKFVITDIVSVGPKRYTLFKSYIEIAPRIYNLEIKPTDTIVASMPRSGTTWTQEIVWLIVNNLDYDKARSQPLMARYPVMGSTILSKFYEMKTKMSHLDNLLSTPDPRFIKTHMPLSLLSPKLLDTAKIVYVARDPRDSAVSTYFFCKLLNFISPEKDLKTFWTYFMNGYFPWHPYFEHVKEAWEARHHPNMLFLFYEDLVADLPKTLHRIAKFFNKNYTNEQIFELCKYVSFENFKSNRSVNLDFDINVVSDVTEENSFIRKGKVGAWRQYFDEEMTAQAQKWIKENLRGTDLRFPSMENECLI